MHEYAYDTELVRLAILLGVVVSMLFYDRYGVTTGGAVVPGYLALFVSRPSHIVVTVVMAGTNADVIGVRADAYNFELELENFDDEWKLIGARWGEVGREMR